MLIECFHLEPKTFENSEICICRYRILPPVSKRSQGISIESRMCFWILCNFWHFLEGTLLRGVWHIFRVVNLTSKQSFAKICRNRIMKCCDNSQPIHYCKLWSQTEGGNFRLQCVADVGMLGHSSKAIRSGPKGQQAQASLRVWVKHCETWNMPSPQPLWWYVGPISRRLWRWLC